MTHVRYHVVPKPGPLWAFELEGAAALFHEDTKEQVLAEAKHWIDSDVEKGDTVSLYIHGEDGEIQEERTYPRSADPSPPEG